MTAKMRILLLIAALYLSFVPAVLADNGEVATAAGGGNSNGPSCPSLGWPAGTVPREHADDACNRAAENSPKRALQVMQKLEESVRSGNARMLHPEATFYCPLDDGDADADAAADDGSPSDPLSTTSGGGFDDANPHQLTLGPSTTWIVQNRATTPVVVSWLAPAESGDDKVQSTLEVSAVNNHIHPAHKDPQAILQPGEWKAIKNVRMGMLFNVRELLTNTDGGVAGENTGGGTPGRVLLRHRTGPITIRNNLGPRNLQCPIQGNNGEGGLIDTKPVQPPEPEDPDEPKPPKVDQKRPDFDYNKRCNSVAKMFRSEVPCPIDLYYVGTDTDWNTPSGHAMPKDYLDVIKGTELDKSSDVAADGSSLMVSQHPASPSSCQEVHSFHLGVNPATSHPEVPAGQFEAWDSPVAYLFTYTSHKFVARLRHDKSLVDEISIERTVVGDCPRERRRLGVQSSGIAAGVGADIGNKDGAGEEKEDVCKDDAACRELMVKTAVNTTSTAASTKFNTTELTPSPAVADKIKHAADKVCTATDSDSDTCKGISVPQASGVKVGSPVP